MTQTRASLKRIKIIRIPWHAMIVSASLLMMACSREPEQRSGQLSTFLPNVSFSELTNHSPFQAIVVDKLVKRLTQPESQCAFVALETNGDTRISVGAKRASKSQVDFVQSLEIGHKYFFPNVYVEWEKNKR